MKLPFDDLIKALFATRLTDCTKSEFFYRRLAKQYVECTEAAEAFATNVKMNPFDALHTYDDFMSTACKQQAIKDILMHVRDRRCTEEFKNTLHTLQVKIENLGTELNNSTSATRNLLKQFMLTELVRIRREGENIYLSPEEE